MDSQPFASPLSWGSSVCAGVVYTRRSPSLTRAGHVPRCIATPPRACVVVARTRTCRPPLFRRVLSHLSYTTLRWWRHVERTRLTWRVVAAVGLEPTTSGA